MLVKKNRGLTFDFILGKLRFQKDEWFTDASEHGYGGLCGSRFFKISHTHFLRKLPTDLGSVFRNIFIAYRELLAVLLAFQVFAKIAPNCFIRVNSDNESVVSWLNKGRCSKKLGFLILGGIEAFKYKYGLRVKAYHIKSKNNVSADALSRGHTPKWLASKRFRCKINAKQIIMLLNNPVSFWRQTRKPPFVKVSEQRSRGLEN